MSDKSATTLAMFLGSLPLDRFLEEYWGQKLWRSPSQELLDLQLFGLQDFASTVAFLRPCQGRLRLVKGGDQMWTGRFEQDGVFSHMTNAVSQGMTLVLERLDLFWPKVVELCGHLAVALGCPVHTNAYLTPANSPGLNPHYDTHDVFVLQLEGEKSWTLGQLERSLPTEQTANGRVNEMRSQAEFSVRPGDVIYIPRGMVHSARCETSYSLHLTISCIPNTFGGEIAKLVASAAHQVSGLRRSLAPSTESAAARRASVSSLMGEIAELVDTGVLPLQQRGPSQLQRCYQLDDAVSQFRVALDIAGIDSTSKLMLQQPNEIELIRESERDFVLRGGTREARLSTELEAATRSILAMSGVFSLSDLPSDSSMERAVRTVVRLLSSSFLRVVG